MSDRVILRSKIVSRSENSVFSIQNSCRISLELTLFSYVELTLNIVVWILNNVTLIEIYRN
jgi:hypothetical protein